MIRLNVVELRQSLADILNRAEYQGERIVIHRRGKEPPPSFDRGLETA